MNRTRRRLVLDTNQIVAAGSRWIEKGLPGRPNCHLRILVLGFVRHRGLYTDAMLAEYSAKLIERGSPHERAERLIRNIANAFERVVVVTGRAPAPPRDPDDEEFLLCAIDGDADFLVSEDQDLLSLRAEYSRPTIARCEEALPRLDGTDPAGQGAAGPGAAAARAGSSTGSRTGGGTR